MRAYRTLARTAWSTVLVYRGEFLLQVAGVAVQTVALFAVWRALFAADPGGEMAGLTWEQMKAYLFVAFLAGTLLSSFTDGQVALRVLDGSVAIDLLRPIDYQVARFAETIGYLVGELLVVAVMPTGSVRRSTHTTVDGRASSLLMGIIVVRHRGDCQVGTRHPVAIPAHRPAWPIGPQNAAQGHRLPWYVHPFVLATPAPMGRSVTGRRCDSCTTG
ncbi:ABC-2 family transporter protein [Verrucosispora sp. TAA-831]|uniref:ABC-2 family transporter protein n=1 Tax=Verrucosispora sp. TAA-831 TaxID=3422227 RepID=UPI003D6E81AD